MGFWFSSSLAGRRKCDNCSLRSRNVSRGFMLTSKGGLAWDRTKDFHLIRMALLPLSYEPVAKLYYFPIVVAKGVDRLDNLTLQWRVKSVDVASSVSKAFIGESSPCGFFDIRLAKIH